jgi:hypothetical protein
MLTCLLLLCVVLSTTMAGDTNNNCGSTYETGAKFWRASVLRVCPAAQ